MRHLAFAALAALCAARAALGIGASQEWVRRYVATNAETASSAVYSWSATNGVVTVVGSNGTDTVTIRGLLREEYALVSTNGTPAAAEIGVTNGTLFSWTGDGAFTNAALGAAVFSTASNFVFRGVNSAPVDGLDRIEGWFDVYGTKIDREAAARLMGGEVAK